MSDTVKNFPARLILLGLMLVSCAAQKNEIEFEEVKYIAKAVSPTLSRIRNLTGKDKNDALSELIQTGKNRGFPLIERDPLYDDYVCATLIYIDTTHRHNIEFEVFGTYDEPRFVEKKLYRLDSTDLYYNSYMIPDDLCFSYRFIINDTITGKRRIISDPMNGNLNPTGEIKNYSWSVLDMRTDDPDWYTKRYNDAGSRIDTFRLASVQMDNTRNIYAYLPPDYDRSDTRYPVIYLFDSFLYLERISVPNVLDNLIREEAIDPVIAIFIDNPTSTSRLTELPLNPRFKDFVVMELVPTIRSRYRITERPDQTVIGGMSYGGLAAAYIAFYHDSIFGRVLSQSGGLWRDVTLKDDNGFEYRGDWLINKYLTDDKKNLKLYLDWGLQEDWCCSSGRRMVRTLDKTGYEYKFVEFNGWHDWSNSRKTFPEGLMYLLKD